MPGGGVYMVGASQPDAASLASEVGDLFQTWASAAGVALVVAQPNGHIAFANRETEELCGLTVGANLLDAFHAKELELVRALLARLDVNGEPVDITAHLVGGETIARFLLARTADEAGRTRAIIGAFRDVTPQGLREQRLEFAASHDDLTGVLSRAAAMRELEARFEQATASAAILYIDLDGFKGVNDGYGHMVGDEVLKTFALRIKSAVGDLHRVARIGGDEFLVVLDVSSTDDALSVARKVANTLSAPVKLADMSLNQRFSIGLATAEGLPTDAPASAPTTQLPTASPARVRAEQLLVDADMAMYVAKRDQQAIALADESTRTWSAQRLVIERDLPAAITNGDIEFHYQPLVDLDHHKWVGAEALLRWEHPELGMLPAELVIERAEVIGCADDLSRYTIDKVARTWAELLRAVPAMAHHQAAINASPRQLGWDGFVGAHLEAIEREGLRPEHFVIEVTESSRVELHTAAAASLTRLAATGSRVCLDDFGVGYSALAYFTQFPIHAIKIDRSLVAELRGDASITERLLRGVVRLAQDMGTRLVGEGVETETSAGLCHSLGIRIGQGHFLGAPMSFDEFCALAPTHVLPVIDPRPGTAGLTSPIE